MIILTKGLKVDYHYVLTVDKINNQDSLQVR